MERDADRQIASSKTTRFEWFWGAVAGSSSGRRAPRKTIAPGTRWRTYEKSSPPMIGAGSVDDPLRADQLAPRSTATNAVNAGVVDRDRVARLEVDLGRRAVGGRDPLGDPSDALADRGSRSSLGHRPDRAEQERRLRDDVARSSRR